MKPLRLLCFALGCAAGTTAALAAEVIQDFHSRIEIAANADMLVTETIRVRAEGRQIRHGIYRDFPNLYRNRWGLRSATGFAVASVTRDGRPEPWHQEARENGVRVYLGSASSQVSAGEHRYELTYRTDRQLGFFSDHDELYWNVTGNGWIFPIEHASAEVRLPAEVRLTAVEAYTGPTGAKGRDYSSLIDPTASHVARFATTRRLEPRAGLTIVVSWPAGLIHPRVRSSDPIAFIGANPGVSGGLLGLALVLVYFLVVWWRVGRDPPGGTIIPLYAPPAGFSPAAVRDLFNMGFDRKCYVANLISLAVKGALTIRESGAKISIQRKNDSVDLLDDERVLFDKLMSGRPELTFENTHHERIRGAQAALQGRLSAAIEKIYFFRNARYWGFGLLFSLVPFGAALFDAPEAGSAIGLLLFLSIWTVVMTAMVSAVVTLLRSGQHGKAIGLALFSLPFLAGEVLAIGLLAHYASPWTTVILTVGIALNGIFYHLLKAPSVAGRQILDQIEGFKRYLTVAEKDRLNLENPPTRTPELFDRFLPYALALDVEQQWAQQFANVLSDGERPAGAGHYSPEWYSGAAFNTAALGSFGSMLGTSLGSAISSSSSPPGSSSGSSSGDSGGGGGGGGSSGGGGGGGGGGGW